jgi:hypothetical protein
MATTHCDDVENFENELRTLLPRAVRSAETSRSSKSDDEIADFWQLGGRRGSAHMEDAERKLNARKGSRPVIDMTRSIMHHLIGNRSFDCQNRRKVAFIRLMEEACSTDRLFVLLFRTFIIYIGTG